MLKRIRTVTEVTLVFGLAFLALACGGELPTDPLVPPTSNSECIEFGVGCDNPDDGTGGTFSAELTGANCGYEAGEAYCFVNMQANQTADGGYAMTYIYGQIGGGDSSYEGCVVTSQDRVIQCKTYMGDRFAGCFEGMTVQVNWTAYQRDGDARASGQANMPLGCPAPE